MCTQRNSNRWNILRLLTLVLVLMLPLPVSAWYGGYPPVPYSGYPGGWYDGYNGSYPPFNAYAEPRWYMRWRMNRYGDYQFVIRLENINPHELYNQWLWYQYANQY